MAETDRALARRDGAAGAAGVPACAASAEAEARLRAALEEVTALDAAVEALSGALAAFAHGWERAVGDAFADLAAAERLVRRLRALEEGLLALAAALADPEAGAPARRGRAGARRAPGAAAARDGRRGAGGASAGGAEGGTPEDAAAGSGATDADDADPEDGPAELEAEALVLKRLYRRLARVLHPDFARDAPEAARLGDLMARVNAAYARGDRTALEVMAERVGAGEPPGELTEAERLAHLERRIATLGRIGASLARERDRLDRSDTARLRAEAARRAGEGGDFTAETRAELAEEAAAAYADALARLDRLAAAARAVARARRSAMAKLEKRGPTGARRAFDPLAETDLVRRTAARLDHRRATAGARALARALEDAARAAPWEVGLTCLAFFAEESGGRPPDAIATGDGLAACWERIRGALPDAPDLARALARLPRHLVVGARADSGEVHAGLQLAADDLAAGVRIALEAPGVAAVAREVLAALGPDERCAGCGADGPARHLHRTRGLDTLHGLACPSCGAILRSYWRYGAVDGIEALAPHALRLGLVAEVTAGLAGTALGFQMLPGEAAGLTAAGLRRRFTDLYLAPYQVALDPAALRVAGPRGALADDVLVAGAGKLRLTVVAGAEGGETAEGLLELLRSRIERRFRP